MSVASPRRQQLLSQLTRNTCLPLISAPMFLVSSPQLVIAQCRAGVIGTLPSLNARTSEIFESWLQQITTSLTPADAPFGVNLIVAPANDRLEADLALCEQYKVPVIITSVGSPGNIAARVHHYGGLILHDVVSVRHAQKAAEAGVDGIVAVCAGAGGHGGHLNPFAFAKEIRKVFDGLIILSGAISSGADILAARLMGADIAYMGTRFLGTRECEISADYKSMLLAAGADDIVNTNLFTGMFANYLAASVERAGLNPKQVPAADKPGVGSGGYGDYKVWKDIWGAGQGVGNITELVSVETLIGELKREYQQALQAPEGSCA